MEDETITLTLGLAQERCDDWLEFCNEVGFDEYAVAEGGGRFEVELTVEQAERHGILSRGDQTQKLIIAERESSKWRDMATAPRDRTEILAYFENGYQGVILFAPHSQKWVNGMAFDETRTASRPIYWKPLDTGPNAVGQVR